MRFIICLVLSLNAVQLFSQATLSGAVVNANQEPLVGATVQVKNSNLGAVTDIDGIFTITGVEEPKGTIEVRSVGYKSIEVAYDVTTGQVVIEMEETAMGLNQVVVTGTMQPVFVSQSPVKVDVITSKHLNTFIPAPASGILEAVQLINGVQEVVACGVCFTSNISINGLPGPYTAVLLDGTPMFGNLASVYGLNSIPNVIIDRVEVIKGPSSTLYGSEAVAGVINIITKDPKNQSALEMDVMATSHGESFGNLAFSPKIGKSSGYVGLNYGYINLFDDENDDGFSDIVNMDRLSIFSKWDIPRKNDKKLTLTSKFYYEDRRNGVREFLEDRNYRDLRGSDDIYGESIYTNRYELFGTYDFQVPFNLRLDFSLSHHDQNSYYGADFYEAQQDIAFGNFVYEGSFEDHSLIGGATLRYQSYDDNTVATESITGNTIINQPDEQFIPGVFIQDEWQLSWAFTLLSGLRIDNYRRHGNIFAPRLNLKFKPGKWTTLRLNSGTGFRIVNLFTEDHAFVTGQREVVISEQLQPEESYNVALNLNHVYTLGSSQGMFDVDLFYTYFSNKIIPDYETQGQIIYANTDGYAVSKGIGVSVNHEFSFPLSFNIGLNMMDVTETDEAGEVTTIEFAPSWTSVFTLNYYLKKEKLTIGYTIQATGPMQLPEVYDLNAEGNPLALSRPVISQPFMLHNLQLNKGLSSRFSIYGGIQNIFAFIPEYSPLVGFNDPNANPGFSSFFDTAYAYAPVHGREFYVGLNFKF